MTSILNKVFPEAAVTWKYVRQLTLPEKLSKWQVEWKATISVGRESSDFKYVTGLGYINPIPDLRTISQVRDVRMLLSAGRSIKSNDGSLSCVRSHGFEVRVPKTDDLVSCLALDSYAIEQTFEEWASEYEYDTDSRSAEKIWQECRDNTMLLVRLFGLTGIQKIRQAYSEY